MIDTYAVFFFVAILIYEEYKQQFKLKYSEPINWKKIVVAILISIMAIIFLWSKTSMKNNINLLAILILFIASAALRRGLGDDRIITFSSLRTAGEYRKFPVVSLSSKANYTEVVFHGTRHNEIEFNIPEEYQVIKSFLEKSMPSATKIVSDKKYTTMQNANRIKHYKEEEEQVLRIRNRKHLRFKDFMSGNYKRLSKDKSNIK